MIDMWKHKYPLPAKCSPLNIVVLYTLYYLTTSKWEVSKNQKKQLGVGRLKGSAAEFLREQIHVAISSVTVLEDK